VKPNPKNWREHPEHQRTALRGILEEVGFAGVILAYQGKDGLTAVDGHLRMEEQPDMQVPVAVLDVTEEEADKLLLTYDPLGAMAQAGKDALISLLASTQFETNDVDAMLEALANDGYQALTPLLDPVVEAEKIDDDDEDTGTFLEEIEEPDYQPFTNKGEVWQLGKHRLMCGDATIDSDIATLMNGEFADLLLTDPPYNVGYVGRTKARLEIANDAMSDDDFTIFLSDAFNAINRHLKKGGVFYIWHADLRGFNFRAACKTVGWDIREGLVWVKDRLVFGRSDYQWTHEPCLYGWKSGAAHYWGNDRTQTTVINVKRPAKSDLHPTMKPVVLYEYQMRNSARTGEAVLDPFGGSGTTIIAAERLNTRGFVMELDPAYCDVIIRRWEKYTGKKAELLINPTSGV
jgi:DNA modification methylase